MDRDINTLHSIHKYTSAVRVVLDNYSGTNPGGIFTNFPLGSCRDSSYLLLKYLRAHGIEGFKLVSANSEIMKNRQSHAWLESEGYIIDITADQFNLKIDAVMPKVFISNTHTWHNKYFSDQTLENGYQFEFGFSNNLKENTVLFNNLFEKIDSLLQDNTTEH